MTERSLIEFHNVTMGFDKQIVHKDLSFKILEGEVVTLLGPSGTGKTVLLKMIIGLLRPISGSIFFMGKDITKMREEELQETRTSIGMLFQGAALFDSLNVFDNVAYSLKESKKYSAGEMQDIVFKQLELVGLDDYSYKYPTQLSGGQRKRVGLARALASSPKVVLFDEPTTGLDPTTRRLIDSLIITLRDDYKITSVVVTHDIDSARNISNRWILLSEARVVAEGPVGIIEQNNKDVSRFVQGYWDS